MYKKGSSFEARLHVLRYKFNFASHCKALREVNWNSRIMTGTVTRKLLVTMACYRSLDVGNSPVNNIYQTIVFAQLKK